MPGVGELQIAYTPRPDASPEAEAAALASAYKFILDAAKQKAAAHAPSNGPDDAKDLRIRKREETDM